MCAAYRFDGARGVSGEDHPLRASTCEIRVRIGALDRRRC
jgi:hypothetical protein